MDAEDIPARPADARRSVPRTDAALADPRLAAAVDRLGRGLVKSVLAGVQERARAGEVHPADVVERTVAALPATASALRPVINATGVLLHTNLGRAPLSAAAREALLAAGGTTDVELDLATGARARRGRSTLDALLHRVPAAQAALVVNNGAAALVLAATALAQGREVVVSRGELVEIGDGFRLPDLLASTGARLREVGTTNRTALADYASAVGPGTGFVLKVHPSNFRVTGFTGDVGVAELSGLGVPVVADIGSGLLTREAALPDEPDATTWLRAGADLVTASGDKLLGGPQCGLLLGRADLVQRLARHPLARALRVDKLTLAALEATLRGPAPPVHTALHADPGRLRERAERIAARLRGCGLDGRAVASEAVIGGGGAPGVTLPSAAVSLPASCADRLRLGIPAVMGRVEGGRCLLDLRAVPEDADPALSAAVERAYAPPAGLGAPASARQVPTDATERAAHATATPPPGSAQPPSPTPGTPAPTDPTEPAARTTATPPPVVASGPPSPTAGTPATTGSGRPPSGPSAGVPVADPVTVAPRTGRHAQGR